MQIKFLLTLQFPCRKKVICIFQNEAERDTGGKVFLAIAIIILQLNTTESDIIDFSCSFHAASTNVSLC